MRGFLLSAGAAGGRGALLISDCAAPGHFGRSCDALFVDGSEVPPQRTFFHSWTYHGPRPLPGLRAPVRVWSPQASVAWADGNRDWTVPVLVGLLLAVGLPLICRSLHQALLVRTRRP